VAEDAIPALRGRQLLRSVGERTEERRDAGQSPRRPARLGVGGGDPERGLAGVADTLRDGRQQQGPAGDRLQVWRDNLDENGASIWMRTGGRVRG